jgi:hypothetical protein
MREDKGGVGGEREGGEDVNLLFYPKFKFHMENLENSEIDL